MRMSRVVVTLSSKPLLGDSEDELLNCGGRTSDAYKTKHLNMSVNGTSEMASYITYSRSVAVHTLLLTPYQ